MKKVHYPRGGLYLRAMCGKASLENDPDDWPGKQQKAFFLAEKHERCQACETLLRNSGFNVDKHIEFARNSKATIQ